MKIDGKLGKQKLEERAFKRGLFERLCIKYKIMAVQPLNKTKIIKKKTNKIRRFQSDEFKRVKVRMKSQFKCSLHSSILSLIHAEYSL